MKEIHCSRERFLQPFLSWRVNLLCRFCNNPANRVGAPMKNSNAARNLCLLWFCSWFWKVIHCGVVPVGKDVLIFGSVVNTV